MNVIFRINQKNFPISLNHVFPESYFELASQYNEATQFTVSNGTKLPMFIVPENLEISSPYKMLSLVVKYHRFAFEMQYTQSTVNSIRNWIIDSFHPDIVRITPQEFTNFIIIIESLLLPSDILDRVFDFISTIDFYEEFKSESSVFSDFNRYTNFRDSYENLRTSLKTLKYNNNQTILSFKRHYEIELQSIKDVNVYSSSTCIALLSSQFISQLSIVNESDRNTHHFFNLSTGQHHEAFTLRWSKKKVNNIIVIDNKSNHYYEINNVYIMLSYYYSGSSRSYFCQFFLEEPQFLLHIDDKTKKHKIEGYTIKLTQEPRSYGPTTYQLKINDKIHNQFPYCSSLNIIKGVPLPVDLSKLDASICTKIPTFSSFKLTSIPLSIPLS